MGLPIDTTKAERRTLRFETVDELLAEVDRIVAAEQAGTLRRTGNWTTGQIFNHVSAWVLYGYNGYPADARWFTKIMFRARMTAVLNNPMRAGVIMPHVPNGTYSTDVVSTEEGAEKLRGAFTRLKNGEPCTHASQVLGELTQEERIQYNLRHAELHLSFLHY